MVAYQEIARQGVERGQAVCSRGIPQGEIRHDLFNLPGISFTYTGHADIGVYKAAHGVCRCLTYLSEGVCMFMRQINRKGIRRDGLLFIGFSALR